MSEKPVVLCIDDERNVVESLKLNLRKHFTVHTALSADEGLDILRKHKDISVVVSDMRMPGQDGAAFLAEVKKELPTIVRVLLTGYSDIEAAMRAVNEGEIFRFLSKPCSPQHLLATINAAVEQNRLINAERVLLQKTLVGSVKALIEVLALSNPMALGRAMRVREKACHAAKRLGIDSVWRIEFAALLSQLGAISLPDDAVRKLYDGEELDEIEQWKLTKNMETINGILGNIPRLEPVTSILAELTQLMRREPESANTERSIEAKLLHTTIELDSLEAQGHPLADAMGRLEGGDAVHDAKILGALRNDPERRSVGSVAISALEDGMVLCEDLKTKEGILILPRGFALNQSSRDHIANFIDQLETETLKVLLKTKDDDSVQGEVVSSGG